jgi:hypothetical protein
VDVAATLGLAFSGEEPRRLAQRLDIHYTPKHSSGLNTAEIELSILQTQRLNRRSPDTETMRRDTSAWKVERNQRGNKTEWHFSTADARIKT